MNKKVYTLSELMNELCIVEGVLRAKASINIAQSSTSRSQSNDKASKKNKAKQAGKQIPIRVTKAGSRPKKKNQRKLI